MITDKVPFSICEVLLRRGDMRIVTTCRTFLPGNEEFVTTVTKKDDEEIYPLRKYAPCVELAEINHRRTISRLENQGWGPGRKLSQEG